MIDKFRFHIVGSGPRTGTTLLHEVMKTCFEFDFASEHEDSINKSNRQIGTEYARILTKQPSELYGIQYPLRFDKNLYVICIIRDPRDMISSFHGRYPDEYWASLRYWKIFLSTFKKMKKHKRILYVKYEDFTKKPDETQSLIQDKFPFLIKRYKFSDYHLHAKPSENSKKALKDFRPIQPNGIGNWKNNLHRIKHQMELHGDISKSLIDLQYEENDTWKNQLPEDNKEFKTKTDEFFTSKELSFRKQKMIKAAVKILLDKLNISY